MLGTGVLIQLPVHARDVLGGDALALSGLLTIFTVGVGVGALLRPRLGGAEHFQGPPAALVIGACCLALALQTPYAGEARGFLALLADGDAASQLLILFLLACAGGFYIVPLNTRLQRAADNAERARVIACANILSALAMTLISIVGMLAHSRPDGGAVRWGILAASAAAAALLHARVGGGARRLLAWPLASFRAPKPLPPGAVVVARHGGVRAALLLAMAVRGRVELHAPPALARHPALRLLAPVATVRASAFDAPLPEDARRTLILLPAPGPAGGAQLLALLARACDSRRPVVLTHLPHRGPMPDRRIRRTPVHLEALPERPRTAHELYDRLCELEYRLDRHDRTTLASLHAAARRFGPGRVILSDLAGRYSYRKLLQSAYALAALLRRALPGDARTVGVLLPNVFATPATFFALHALGRTPAMLNYTAGAASLESACRTAELTHIVSSRRFIEQAGLAPLAERLAAQVTVLWLEDLRGELTARDKLQAALRAARRPGRGDPNAHAVVLFTSGSEGDPKGVVLSHRNLQRNRAQVRAVLSFYPRDRVLLSLPLFHSFGLGVGLLMPLALGLPCVLATSPLRFKEIPQQIAADRITVFFSTNTFLGGYAQHATRAQLRSLRLTVAGAERLQPAMQELWRERFGIDVQQGYGVTETAPAVSVNAPACARDDTVGRLLPAMELRIAPLPDDPQPERGRLWLRGPNVMLGYWKADRPGVLAPPADGWHDTGDIASLDADGFLRLHGRARRFAKIGGEMVSLEQVEQVVARIWPEHRHLVCAVADARRGEQLVLLTEHPDPDARALADALARQGLPELARPRRIRSIPELPVLGSGKPDLRAGQALAEAVLG